MQYIETNHIIIGAGAMGRAAAYHLARRGESLVLLEQFALGHDRGSSHGAARITRHSYADAHYARLMPAAFRAWKELEADAGESLYIRTGGVSFSPPGVDYAARVAANLQELGVPFWHSSGRDWNIRNPAFRVPHEYDVVFEPDAGMLAAARALALEIELARFHGGPKIRVLEKTPVRHIDLEDKCPVVVTDTAQIVGDRLIVAAGAWLKPLLPSLQVPLRVTPRAGAVSRADGPASLSDRSIPRLHFQRRRRTSRRSTACPSFRTWASRSPVMADPNSIPTCRTLRSARIISRPCGAF